MIWGIRAVFILFSGFIGVQLADLVFLGSQTHGFLGGVSSALFFVAVEIGFTRRYISIVSIALFGILCGFVVSAIFINALFLVPWLPGNLGLIEFGTAGALTLLGVTGTAAAGGVLLDRFISFWLVLVIGLAFASHSGLGMSYKTGLAKRKERKIVYAERGKRFRQDVKINGTQTGQRRF